MSALLDSEPDHRSPESRSRETRDRSAKSGWISRLPPLLRRVFGGPTESPDAVELERHLADATSRFEERVSERTADLGRANARLRLEVAERDGTVRGLRLAGVAVENTNEGVVITDAALRIVAVNQAFSQITGYAEAEVVGEQPNLFQPGRHDQAFFTAMWATIHDLGRWQGEIWNQRKNGAIYPQLLSITSVRDDTGALTNYVGVFSDISAIKDREARFDHLAHHDALTGLPNRLLFTARGKHALARAGRNGGHVALISIGLDFDRFDHLDDTLGHPAGDGLLQQVAERLATCLRADDTVGRLGGDGFTVLLEDLVDADRAGAVARKMLEAFDVAFNLAGNELFVAASIGVSVFPQDGGDLSALVRQAESAMHRAREHSRGNLQFYTADLARTAVERFRLEGELRNAVRRDQFLLHFQPQVSVRNGAIVGAEALVRWRHPDLGLVPPTRFIPLAEETGLVTGIGAWVLRAACRQVSDWMIEGRPALRVAINVSAQEIYSSPLAEKIAEVLRETGVDPGLLEIEITESSVMADVEAAVTALRAVKDLGVTLALDDFGTGYSSLTYLRRFPIDRLKLDGAFIRQLDSDDTAPAIARAAIELGHGLRLDVVAEGVETPAQLEFLRANGCDAYQGFLFGGALPPTELGKLLPRESA